MLARTLSIAILVTGSLYLNACRSCSCDSENPSLTVEQIKNATYDCYPGLGIFTLEDGKFAAPDNKWEEVGVAAIYKEGEEAKPLTAFGDIDQDGDDYAAVGIWYSGGGSGTWIFIYAVLNDAGNPTCAAAAQLGDRPHMHGIDIEDGAIVVDVNLRSPEDAMVEASIPARIEYRHKSGKLVVVLAPGALAAEWILQVSDPLAIVRDDFPWVHQSLTNR